MHSSSSLVASRQQKIYLSMFGAHRPVGNWSHYEKITTPSPFKKRTFLKLASTFSHIRVRRFFKIIWLVAWHRNSNRIFKTLNDLTNLCCDCELIKWSAWECMGLFDFNWWNKMTGLSKYYSYEECELRKCESQLTRLLRKNQFTGFLGGENINKI